MSANKLAIFLFSSFLIFGGAWTVSAQSNASSQEQKTKQTTKQSSVSQGTASKDDIKSAQQALKDKGMYSGNVDGMMNTDTKKGLRDFQQKNNLKVTGTLDHETMSALGISHAAAPEKRSEKKSSATGKSTTGKPASHLSRDKVRAIQTSLKQQGLDPGPIDGIMGVKTMTSIRSFQSHNGLEVTGTLTTETEQALNAPVVTARSKPEPKLEESQPKSELHTSDINTNAANSQEVMRIQQTLAGLMYNPGEANGIMTPQTQQAIREFQYLNNLPVTGELDDQTMIAMQDQGTGSFQSASIEREKPAVNTGRETKQQTYEPSNKSSQKSDTSIEVKRSKKEQDSSDTKSNSDYAKRVSKSADVLQDLTAAADKRIPNELLERAEAIAVIPNMIKGAFGIGGRYGKGVVSARMEDGRWSPPAFVEIGDGSFGAQLGVSSTDLVFVFTDKRALDLLKKGKDLKLGVDASAVAGPLGRSAEAGVNLNLGSAIYAYSRAKGLFAGIALDGAVLNIEDHANEKVYGKSVNPEDIFNGKLAVNSTGRPFIDVLEKVVPKKRISQK